jgi:hypothetical protein
MPPQPLSSFQSKASVNIGGKALRQHPNLSARIAEIIAYWSSIEASLGRILGRMLGGNARPAIAMYAAIRNSQAQMAALEAAAKEVLDSVDIELFGAVLAVVKRAGGKRHKIAHWIWGEASGVPDCLILIDPDAIHEYTKLASDLLAGASNITPNIDLAHAFAYKESDFDEIFEEMRAAYFLTLRFMTLLMTPAPNVAVRHQLSSDPRIQTELQKIRKPLPDGA